MPASSKQKYSKTLAFPNAYYESFSNLGQSVELFCAYDYSSLDRDLSRNSRNKMRAHITCRMGRYKSAPLVTKGLTGSIKQSNLFIESPRFLLSTTSNYSDILTTSSTSEYSLLFSVSSDTIFMQNEFHSIFSNFPTNSCISPNCLFIIVYS